MSYRHVQQLQRVRNEFDAVQAALVSFERNWQRDEHTDTRRVISFESVLTAAEHLEATYTIRIFAQFESILKGYVRSVRPNARLERIAAEPLINRAATRLRVPSAILSDVHAVRVFRNRLAHEAGTAPAVVFRFRNAITVLNRFLALIPDGL